MAVASWMLRERSFRTGRVFCRHKSETEEDFVDLDATKDSNENTYEILSNVCKKDGLSDGKRLGYLNTFAKLIEQMGSLKKEFIMSKEDILCCLKVGLVSNNTLVRAGGLRVIRYFISTPDDIILLNKLQIPYLIARSIDLILKNDHERIQAFRLALKILNICPKYFSASITRSLVSLANSISENKDRMSNSCLAILCQLCILNPELLLECNGQTAILRSTLEISQARVNECLVGCLLYLMNKPDTRTKANIHLEYLTSIYCDWQRKRAKKETNNIYTSSMLSILAALRTWTGVFHLCQPSNVSGMKAVIDILYLNQFEVRKAILELLYEILGLDHEEWTDEIVAGINNIDPSKYRDLWSLSEKFIAGEGKDILPHKAHSRTNLTEIHLALIVYSLIECGLLAALVEVIITTDAILSVQAIILLGFILHLSYKLLPSEVLELSPKIPTLIHYAANGLPRERAQALMAVSSLCKIHELLKKRPAPFSLFLHQLLNLKNISKASVHSKKKGVGMQIKNIDEHIKESRVFNSKDPKNWVWNHIVAILKCQNESFFKLEEPQHKNFIRKLVNFYKPSGNEYCNIKYSGKTQSNNFYTTTSFALWKFLIQSDEEEPRRILTEFLADLHAKLQEIISHSNIHEILFSPQQLYSTMCQHYFLMIGSLLDTQRGEEILEKCSILKSLMEIVMNPKHEFYVKLILSSLDYNVSCKARDILNKALTSGTDNVRMYATELLLVLARSDVNNFSKWGLDLLIGQMYDENKIIATASINILHELSYDEEYLESLINIRPSLLHLGDKGRLLLIRFLSSVNGFLFLNGANFVEKELENWEKEYNHRYVGLLEGDLHDSLTLYQRNENGKYSRRFSNNKHRWKDVFVYPHLYGELSQHEKGFQALLRNGFIFKMIQVINNAQCGTDAEILDLKSSLWGLSNMATSGLGLRLLEQENSIQKIVNIAQSSPVLSVRATAFYCICLISTTVDGANSLSKYGWYSVRHNRREKWPIVQTEYLLMNEENDLKNQDVESTPSVTYESDDAEAASMDNEKFFNEVASLQWKPKKASTLPRGTINCFDENHASEKYSVHSRSMGEGDIAGKCLGGATSAESSHQRSYSENFHRKKRHFSDTCCEGSEVQQKLSFHDAVGLATLQSLHNYRRPDVTSAVNSELEQSEFRKNISSQDHTFNLQMSDFEAPNPPKLFSNTSSSSLGGLAKKALETNREKDANSSNCSYKGISLPKTLSDFLMLSDIVPDKSDEDRKSLRKRGSHSFSEMEQVKEIEEVIEDDDLEMSTSSESSDSELSKRGGGKKVSGGSGDDSHNQASCIACCIEACKNQRQRKTSSESYRTKTDAETFQGNQTENSPAGTKSRLKSQSENVFHCFAGNSGESLLKEEWQATETELDDSNGSLSTPRTAVAAAAAAISRTKIRRDVLKHINRMCNPVWAKSSEQSLLQYKQRHPDAFEDPCLYSSVCDVLSNSACRVSARRFIQELFLDVCFSKVFDEADSILQRYLQSKTVPITNPAKEAFSNCVPSGVSKSVSDSPAFSPALSSSPSPLSPSEKHGPDAETHLSKSLLLKPKSTSPINLMTLFENVSAPGFDVFDCRTVPVGSGGVMISSGRVQLTFKSGEGIPNS